MVRGGGLGKDKEQSLAFLSQQAAVADQVPFFYFAGWYVVIVYLKNATYV